MHFPFPLMFYELFNTHPSSLLFYNRHHHRTTSVSIYFVKYLACFCYKVNKQYIFLGIWWWEESVEWEVPSYKKSVHGEEYTITELLKMTYETSTKMHIFFCGKSYFIDVGHYPKCTRKNSETVEGILCQQNWHTFYILAFQYKLYELPYRIQLLTSCVNSKTFYLHATNYQSNLRSPAHYQNLNEQCAVLFAYWRGSKHCW